MPEENNALMREFENAKTSLNTVSQWLSWLESMFEQHELYFGHGTDSAWDEAVHLLLYVLQLPVDSDKTVLSRIVTTAEKQQLLDFAGKRIFDRQPLPYLTHQAWFMRLPFYVDHRVLIPRSPFAEWIEKRFQPWVNPEQVRSILEVGTGSGCMAIAAAKMFPEAKVVAVDIDPDALEVAKINVLSHEVQDRVELVLSDCYSALQLRQFDIIMSNPPYVGEQEMQTLPAEYRHEPVSALAADQDGLAVVARLLSGAKRHLTANGILMLEVGNSEQALVERYPELPLVWLEQEFGGHGLCLIHEADL